MRDKVYCPYCNAETEAVFVHNGIGFEQVSPYNCYRCGSHQIMAALKDGLSSKEIGTGWYEPPGIWWDRPRL